MDVAVWSQDNNSSSSDSVIDHSLVSWYFFQQVDPTFFQYEVAPVDGIALTGKSNLE
jgi:hypothetical protein